MLDLLIIPPQPVDAEDVQKVPFLDGLYEPCVLGPVEILAGLFIHVSRSGLWLTRARIRRYCP